MDFAITFLEGVITFVSPCLLPMLPIYVAYFAGGAERANSGPSSLERTLVCAIGFVVGFTVVFTLLGALAGTVGHLLFEYQGAFNAICGII
ncbi:MAG: cytochrome c biogenesis protein CcdA, partial [Eggerthellaceae bacterium]|nr:cytochrome c biogenesis protein CcdA [Eggerthellaceae bacterium]